MAVPDIIKKVFQDRGCNDFSLSLTGTYAPREYCVQYRESDFSFVSRLMEECGIYYFFRHDEGQHTLVLGDDSGSNPDCPEQSEFRFYIKTTAGLDEDVVTSWQVEQEMRTGKCTLTHYNFETPSSSLLSTTATLVEVGGNGQLEIFDYPGKHLNQSDGQALSKIRMQEEESVHRVVHGASNARSMVAGYKFTLKDHYRRDMNTSYLLTDIEHTAYTTAFGATKEAQEEHYSNSFRCIPASVPYRPRRQTPRATVEGPQPAVVVGPAGQEIYVDQYGRVKVQFFWDREGQKNENSSCWLRVSQLFAGKGWGAGAHPRIGQEVIVDFLEGDPDQPIITGRVYNAEQMPPGQLPGHMNISGFRTRSTPGGGEHDANVLSFDDTMGSEMFYQHAQKDMTVHVENDQTYNVDNDQNITVTGNRNETVEQGDESVEIAQGDRTHTVSQGDETLIVKQGNRYVSVLEGNDVFWVAKGQCGGKVGQGSYLLELAQGDHNVTVSQGKDVLSVMGNRMVTVHQGTDFLHVQKGNAGGKIDEGSYLFEVDQGDYDVTVDSGNVRINAGQSLTLKVGDNSITIDATGVTIKAALINIQGEAMLQAKAPLVMLN
jgi:type VI secretion system secreted protein VgrG